MIIRYAYVIASLSLPLGLAAQTPPPADPAPAPAEEAAPNQAAPESQIPEPSRTPDSDPAAVEQELQAKQQELVVVARQIDELQMQAEAAEAVQTSRNEYKEVLTEEMVRSAPELEQAIDRQADLVTELTAEEASPGAEAEVEKARQEKLAEYKELRQQLSPVEQQAHQVEAVRNARTQYFNALVAEMQRINPEAQRLLARHRELLSAVRNLSQRAGRS